MSNILKPIICSQCGSNNITNISKNRYKCNVCGTTFILDKEKDEGFNEDEILFIEKNKRNEDFIYEALEGIMINKNIPTSFLDACKISFESDYAYVYLIEGTVYVSYKAKVGTNREIIHYKKNKDGETIEEKEIVTDWSPVSSNEEIETYASAVAARKETPKFNKDILGPNTELSEGAKAFIKEKPMEMNDGLLDDLYEELKSSAESEAVSDLYDYDDYEVISTRSSIRSIDSYKKYLIPTYAIRFFYQGNNYVAYAFARENAYNVYDGKALNSNYSNDLIVDTNMEKPLLYSTAAKFFYLLVCTIFFFFLRKVTDTGGIILSTIYVIAVVAFFYVAITNTKKYNIELENARQKARDKIKRIAQNIENK